MSHFFVSYSRKDEEIVDRFVSGMAERGNPMWQDKSGKASGIPFSTKWFEIIEEALHSSSGVFVIMSENWEKSSACQKELEIIRKSGIPEFDINIEDIFQDFEKTVEKADQDAKYWAKKSICRQILFSSAYANRKGTKLSQLIIHPFGIRDTFSYLFDGISELRDEAEKYETINPEMYPYLKKYVSASLKYTIFHLLELCLSIALIIALIVYIYPVFSAVSSAKKNARMSLEDRERLSQMKAGLVNDPVKSIIATQGMSFTVMWMPTMSSLFSNAAKLESVSFPSGYSFEKTIDMYENTGSETSERFSVSLAENAGTMYIRDYKTGSYQTITAPSAVRQYVFSSTGRHMAYCTDNRIFICDPSNISSSVQLYESFYDIDRLAFIKIDNEEKIAVDTIYGIFVVWDNPFLQKEADHISVKDGYIMDPDKGEAVYIAENKLYLNKNNEETLLSLGIPEGSTLMNVTAGRDVIAVSYSYQDRCHVICISADQSDIIADIPVDEMITNLVLSDDQKDVYCTGETSTLIRIKIDEKSVSYSDMKGRSSAVLPYDIYLGVLNDQGDLTFFNKQLQPISESMNVSRGFLKADQFILSNDGYLFALNQRPANSLEFLQTDMANKKTERVIFDVLTPVSYNSALTLSDDGKSAAYGYSDGVIRIFNTYDSYHFFENHSISEKIMDMRFSSDNESITALGESGTVYHIETGSLDHTYTFAYDKELEWNAVNQRLVDKYNNYFYAFMDESE